jgi:16S rRNA (guanine1207-N2)-methyltransferase
MAEDEGDVPVAEHYFAERPRSASQPRELRFLYRGEVLTFQVDAGVFASHGIDPGTALLIEALAPRETDRVLDLGCGWGAIGIAAARSAHRGSVLLTDVNRRAVQLARRNVRRNDIPNAEVRPGPLFRPVAEEVFDLIATNPPYHVGRPTILALLAEAPAHLADEGTLLMVGKGSQGILFYQNWLQEHWPGTVEVVGRGSGYRVLAARKVPASRKA